MLGKFEFGSFKSFKSKLKPFLKPVAFSQTDGLTYIDSGGDADQENIYILYTITFIG